MKTLYLILVWFGAVVALSVTGAFDTGPGRPPLGLLLAITIPIIVYVVDRSYLHGALLGGIHELDGATAIFLQTQRALGVVFLVEYARGHLPAGFALPAGLGDVAVGLAAPWVAQNLAAKKPHAAAVARFWNYLGIFDLVLALTMGVTHGGPPLGIFASEISNQAVTQYPLSLIPTWAVPLAFILHLRTLQSLGPVVSSLSSRRMATA
ncbi:hypothetical protein [Chthoniobacter flavus]|nr:hypothetical protein [Chthoniobacter flavus]